MKSQLQNPSSGSDSGSRHGLWYASNWGLGRMGCFPFDWDEGPETGGGRRLLPGLLPVRRAWTRSAMLEKRRS